MAPRNSLFKAALVKKVMGDEFRRKKQAKKRSCVLSVFLQIASKRKSILLSLFHMILLLTNQNMPMPRPIRSERRLPRLQGWWDTVVRHYDDNRFKKNFRVTRATFLFLLDAIKIDLQKEVVTELPITPEIRLAVCLYRLGRGDYLHTISELTGLGTSTVCEIVVDVCKTIVNRLWDSCVAKHMPTDLVKLKESMVSFEELWQFPCCFGTVDGCHIPMKCPRGGQKSITIKKFFFLLLSWQWWMQRNDSFGPVLDFQATVMMGQAENTELSETSEMSEKISETSEMSEKISEMSEKISEMSEKISEKFSEMSEKISEMSEKISEEISEMSEKISEEISVFLNQ